MAKQVRAIEISEDQLSGVQAVAGREGLSTEELVGELLDQFLADDCALQAALAEADSDIAAGRTFAHEDVVGRFESRLSATAEPKAA